MNPLATPALLLLLWLQTLTILSSLPPLFATGLSSSSLSSSSLSLPPPMRRIPEKVLIGYGHNCNNVKKAVVEDGVNIVIWVFLNIVHDDNNNGDGAAKIETDLDLKGIEKLMTELDETGYDHVIHLVSFGGWNGPHLDPALTATQWYQNGWKDSIVSQLFHGIDWDLEGHDDLTKSTNVFTVDCLGKMGHISRFMKQDGYIVGCAPPQSYLNFDSKDFSRYVNLTEPDRRWHSEFHYFGSNVYSYLLAKYGDYIDFVSVQLYESYSLAAMAVYHDQQLSADEYLVQYIRDLVVDKQSKFYVDFEQDASLNFKGQYVELPLHKLVIGLANGWAADPNNNGKHIYISPKQCQEAYDRLRKDFPSDLSPRGFMFWTIEERGTRDVYLARDIAKFLFNNKKKENKSSLSSSSDVGPRDKKESTAEL